MKVSKLSIDVLKLASEFAENKDVAKQIRDSIILPNVKDGIKLTINFAGVQGATQSFIHALISEPLRLYGESFLDVVDFKSCNKSIKNIILTVVEYSLLKPEDL
jgi:hypothetical protein